MTLVHHRITFWQECLGRAKTQSSCVDHVATLICRSSRPSYIKVEILRNKYAAYQQGIKFRNESPIHIGNYKKPKSTLLASSLNQIQLTLVSKKDITFEKGKPVPNIQSPILHPNMHRMRHFMHSVPAETRSLKIIKYDIHHRIHSIYAKIRHYTTLYQSFAFLHEP